MVGQKIKIKRACFKYKKATYRETLIQAVTNISEQRYLGNYCFMKKTAICSQNAFHCLGLF